MDTALLDLDYRVVRDPHQMLIMGGDNYGNANGVKFLQDFNHLQ
jgi:hypothetical protein